MRKRRSCGSWVRVEEEGSEWRGLGQVLSWVPIVVYERATVTRTKESRENKQ